MELAVLLLQHPIEVSQFLSDECRAHQERYEHLVEEQPDVEQSGNQLDTLNNKNKTQE